MMVAIGQWKDGVILDQLYSCSAQSRLKCPVSNPHLEAFSANKWNFQCRWSWYDQLNWLDVLLCLTILCTHPQVVIACPTKDSEDQQRIEILQVATYFLGKLLLSL